MENRPDLKFQKIHENIRSHFDFLFESGFCIISVMFVGRNDENWMVTLMKDDFFVSIQGNGWTVKLALGILQPSNDIWFFDLYDFIHLADDEEILQQWLGEIPLTETQQFTKMARLLKNHIEDILAQIGEYGILPPEQTSTMEEAG